MTARRPERMMALKGTPHELTWRHRKEKGRPWSRDKAYAWEGRGVQIRGEVRREGGKESR